MFCFGTCIDYIPSLLNAMFSHFASILHDMPATVKSSGVTAPSLEVGFLSFSLGLKLLLPMLIEYGYTTMWLL